jgi:hypothetical protein
MLCCVPRKNHQDAENPKRKQHCRYRDIRKCSAVELRGNVGEGCERSEEAPKRRDYRVM